MSQCKWRSPKEISKPFKAQTLLARRRCFLRWTERCKSGAWRYSRKLGKILLDSDIAMTRTGYLCLVAQSAIPGDTVAVIDEFPTPFVLRKSQQSRKGSFFQLVGPCHVHGLMYREIENNVAFKQARE
jgi:hypothetical protein